MSNHTEAGADFRDAARRAFAESSQLPPRTDRPGGSTLQFSVHDGLHTGSRTMPVVQQPPFSSCWFQLSSIHSLTLPARSRISAPEIDSRSRRPLPIARGPPMSSVEAHRLSKDSAFVPSPLLPQIASSQFGSSLPHT